MKPDYIGRTLAAFCNVGHVPLGDAWDILCVWQKVCKERLLNPASSDVVFDDGRESSDGRKGKNHLTRAGDQSIP